MFTSSTDNPVITLATRQPYSPRLRYNIEHDGDDIGTPAECWVARSVRGETDGDEKADHDPLRNTPRLGAERSPTSRADTTWIESRICSIPQPEGGFASAWSPIPNSRNGVFTTSCGSHEGRARRVIPVVDVVGVEARRCSRDRERMQYGHPGRQYPVMGFGTMLMTGKPQITADP